MSIECVGIDMYDIRTTVKAEAYETILMGESCYIGADGLVHVVDGQDTIVHGWALKGYSDGDMVTLVTTCRMRVTTVQTPGARAYIGSVAGGSAPSTTLGGVVCGYAVTTSLLFCFVPIPAADGA